MGKYRFTLLPEPTSFEVEDLERILYAAIRQNVSIPYTCRNGTCRTCLYQIMEGEVLQEETELCMITEQELVSGRRLLCMSSLKSDASAEKVVRRKKHALFENLEHIR